MSAVQAFRRAVVSDERSFTSDLLDQANQVLHRVAAPTTLCEQFAKTITLIKVIIFYQKSLDLRFDPSQICTNCFGLSCVPFLFALLCLRKWIRSQILALIILPVVHGQSQPPFIKIEMFRKNQI